MDFLTFRRLYGYCGRYSRRLGYMQLGQASTTLGEAQRVKLSAELGRRRQGTLCTY
jgi:excinuclease UvrABC ATPase subunit